MKEYTPASFVRLFRGVSSVHDRERVGMWWSDNPYYAMRYSNGVGTLFTSLVTCDVLGSAVDVSLDEGYENYAFKDVDPPDVRPVSQEEYDALTAHAASTLSGDMPGGSLRAWPLDIGRIVTDIFNRE